MSPVASESEISSFCNMRAAARGSHAQEQFFSGAPGCSEFKWRAGARPTSDLADVYFFVALSSSAVYGKRLGPEEQGAALQLQQHLHH